MKEIWLSPSDLSYFWSDSKVGFYDKYVLKINRPKQAFPSMFNTIDLCMKNGLEKVTLSELVDNAPEGTISHDEINVQSKPFVIGDFEVGFKGKLDCLLIHDDDTYSVVDYKTTHLSSKLKDIYFLQLMAYAYSLSNPLNGHPKNIKGLGLLVYEPKTFKADINKGNLEGTLTWVEIPFDKEKFKNWITQELTVLLRSERENIFVSSSDQKWEKYVNCFYVEEIENT